VVKHIHDFVDVLAAQAVLVAVLHKAPAGIHHEQPLALRRPRLIQHDDAGGNARAVEQVRRQADDALDVALAHQVPPNAGLGIAAKQHPVGQNHRRLARTLQRLEDVQQKGIVAVFIRRCPILKPLELVRLDADPIAPRLVGEGGIRHRKVEPLEAAVRLLPVGIREGVVAPEFRRDVVVQNHVHLGQHPGGIVHLLTKDRQPPRGLIRHLQQQGTGAAGGVIHRLVLAGGLGDAHHLGQNPRHLRRGVELALALARLRGKVAHQVLVGIPQQVIPIGPVRPQVKALKNAHQVREAIDHLLALAQFVFVVEVVLGGAEQVLQPVLLGELADHLVDLVADFLVALQRRNVVERAARRHHQQGVGVSGIFVGDILHEQQRQHVVLVLAGIHAAAQFIAAGPQGAVEFGLLYGHSGLSRDRLVGGKARAAPAPRIPRQGSFSEW
jgi:hypothetical protein